MTAGLKQSNTTYCAADLAAQFGLALRGDGQARVSGVAPLASATRGDLAFLANSKYTTQLASTTASVVVMRAADAEGFAGTALIANDPYAAFAKISALFETAPPFAAGVHPTAVIDPSAEVDAAAMIGPLVVIGARSLVRAGARIEAHCVIGEDCVIGTETTLMPRVTLVTRVRIGKRVRIHSGAILGAAGFGLAMENGAWLNVPQLGGVVVGDDCEIGANTTIDRGALGDTVLGNDVRLDNLIQIAHNVVIGDHTAMAGCAAVAGSATIGRYCLIGGGAGILGHLSICDKVTVTARSLVTHSIREPGEYSSGTPLMKNSEWRRSAARFKSLDRMARQLKRYGDGESSDD